MMKYIFFFLGFSILLFSCKKDETSNVIADYSSGFMIVNEGAFLGNNASISWYGAEGKKEMDAYFAANGVVVGDVLQDFKINGSRGYAVVNNSQKVEVVDAKTMEHKATISGLSYPRYIIMGGNGKAYLTNGSSDDGTVEVIDLSSNTVIQSIEVGNGPEKMAISGNYLAVCNSGGWLSDNTVSIIDITSETVVNTVVVADRPTSIAVDALGDFVVLCSGETQYDLDWNIIGNTDAALYSIDPVSFSSSFIGQIGVNGDHPIHLAIAPDGQTVYFLNDGLYQFNLSGSFDPQLMVPNSYNGLSIDPSNGHIWLAGPTDFVSTSMVYHYSAIGEIIGSYPAGIGAKAVVFR